MRIKSWEARATQLELLGAARECLPKLVARLKHARVDDDAEDERDEEIVLYDCLLPQCTASPEVSPLMRRTEREVRKDSCDKEHMVFAEGDAIHVLCASVSFQTARLRVLQTSSRVMCDSCGRPVSAVQGLLLSDSGQSQFMQEQVICAGCLMTAGTERWETHECNKTGHLRKDCSVYKKHIAEKETSPKES